MTLGSHDPHDRRRFLGLAASSVGLLVAGCAASRDPRAAASGADEPDEPLVTPGEDLMQEHGVLERVLLVYEECARRLGTPAAPDPSIVPGAAGLVRGFVEDYHERLEERFVFPRLEAAKREVALVATLRAQHEAGRRLTDEIARLGARPEGDPTDLVRALRDFVRMYRPHAAREDTVLFPAFRSVLGADEYRELGEQFEDEEHRRFGERGFEEAVGRVAGWEDLLGIDALESFTPR